MNKFVIAFCFLFVAGSVYADLGKQPVVERKEFSAKEEREITLIKNKVAVPIIKKYGRRIARDVLRVYVDLARNVETEDTKETVELLILKGVFKTAAEAKAAAPLQAEAFRRALADN